MKLPHIICRLSLLLSLPFCLAACDSGKESGKNAAAEPLKAGEALSGTQQPVAQNGAAVTAPAGAAFTDDEKFSYMLGNQFGVPPYINSPKRFGEMLSLDAMVQGVVEAVRNDRDSTVKMQMTRAELTDIESQYARIARDREAAGDSAAPVKMAGPIENKPVVIDSSSSAIQKYSYATGVQIAYMFIGIEHSFEQQFSLNHFVYGLREGVANVIDESFRTALPRDSLMAVNGRYMKKIRDIMEERRRKASAEQGAGQPRQ